MKNKLMSMVIICIVGTALVATWAWRPKSRYVFGGIWAGYDPSNPDTAIFYTHTSRDDVVGRREFSYYMNHFNFDATLGGLFPDAVMLADGVGRGYATGRDSFHFSSLVVAVNATGYVQYYAIGSGDGVFLNKDEQYVEALNWAVYLPGQDVDPHDGIPEGEPLFAMQIPLYMQRVPYLT